MKTVYEDGMTMLEARNRYFEVNGFGKNGGYDDAWVDFKLGPIPMPFPNTAGRVRAVTFHDLHHIVTGYDTDTRGEFEISAWEIATGCGGFFTAWGLAFGGLGMGALFFAPRRTFRAFLRGRHDRSTFDGNYEELLKLTVAEARARFSPTTNKPAPKATFADVVTYAAMVAIGQTVATVTMAAVLPLVPVGIIANLLRKRATTAAA